MGYQILFWFEFGLSLGVIRGPRDVEQQRVACPKKLRCAVCAATTTFGVRGCHRVPSCDVLRIPDKALYRIDEVRLMWRRDAASEETRCSISSQSGIRAPSLVGWSQAIVSIASHPICKGIVAGCKKKSIGKGRDNIVVLQTYPV